MPSPKVREMVILSGKGGTGKTSLVGALAALIPEKVLVDCDVDAPDLHLLLGPQIQSREEFLGGRKARILSRLCTSCGECREVCRFEAISEEYRVDETACEGCGVCVHFCPFGAIEFPPVICGEWFQSATRFGPLIHAQLAPGQENSGLLVARIRGQARDLAEKKGVPLILVDGPPGIGCPVISSLTGASSVLLVTEPTLTGLHDLDRVVSLSRHFRIPPLVLINKVDLNPEMAERIAAYCGDNDLSLAGTLPYDPAVTKAMVRGKTILEWSRNGLGEKIRSVWERAQQQLITD